MIPVIINNRDLLTWPKVMLEKIKTYIDVGEIIIIDNNSTNPLLLEWYKTNPCIIKYVKNLGQAAPWISGVVSELNSEYYVVTDSDMGLENTPIDTLVYLKNKLEELSLEKIGLGLDWQIVSYNSPYYDRMQGHERTRWQNSAMQDNVYLDIPIDTTFALYKRKEYFIGGASTTFPYVARHIPWELSKEEYELDKEFKYYIEHAINACSYKNFLGL